ncbi:hypothetical protein DV532_26925 (plasmid) [Pseudomonas sp. Leaf58]|nr:hypothetical protein DV532_26925 [Pseudomonas sp. Leaf58]
MALFTVRSRLSRNFEQLAQGLDMAFSDVQYAGCQASRQAGVLALKPEQGAQVLLDLLTVRCSTAS